MPIDDPHRDHDAYYHNRFYHDHGVYYDKHLTSTPDNDEFHDDDPGDCTDHHLKQATDDNDIPVGNNDPDLPSSHDYVYCTACHDYHIVTSQDTPCAEGAWTEVASCDAIIYTAPRSR